MKNVKCSKDFWLGSSNTSSFNLRNNGKNSQPIIRARQNQKEGPIFFRNLGNSCSCNTVPNRMLQNTKAKTLLVNLIENTKSDSRHSCSGKRLADWRKMWKRTIPNRKTKIMKENKFVELERIVEGSDTKRFFLFHEWILGSQKCCPSQNRGGKMKRPCMRERKTFLCFLAQENLKKHFFQKWCSSYFEIMPHCSNPPLLYH